MNNSDNTRRISISQAANIEEIAEYWDTHSLDDHWEQTEPADFEIRVTRNSEVNIDPEPIEHRRSN